MFVYVVHVNYIFKYMSPYHTVYIETRLLVIASGLDAALRKYLLSIQLA